MTTPDRTLSTRELNRALLARQMLLRRETGDIAEAVEKLVGLQAQEPLDPYVALWSRLEGFNPHELGALIEARQAVRLALMRSTIHLVTARDCLAIRPVLSEMLARNLYTASPYGRQIEGMDIGALLDAARKALADRPLTSSELGKRLQERWPERDATAMANAARNHLALVQVPPRAVWGKSGLARLASAEQWLSQPLATEVKPHSLILRYLAAFGPAGVQDARTWSGLPGLAAVFEDLRPGLRIFRDERGRELFDLPDAPLPDAETEAPVRFLPEYDNVFLSHADRGRIVDPEHRAHLNRGNGYRSTVLIDGFVQATWELRQDRQSAVLSVQPLVDLSARAKADVEAEAGRLLDFLAAPSTHEREVRLLTPG